MQAVRLLGGPNILYVDGSSKPMHTLEVNFYRNLKTTAWRPHETNIYSSVR